MNAQIFDARAAMATGQVFNVFRRRDSDLACAVPLDRPVPHFIGDAWQYWGEADLAFGPAVLHVADAVRRANRFGFYFFRMPHARPVERVETVSLG